MKRWEDLGNERWKLSITPDDPDDPTPPSVYRGTREEISEMLADSQEHANRRIGELKRVSNGHAAPQPTPLTAEQRLQTVAELSNPATVDQGIIRVVESKLGPLEEQRARQQREDKQREEQEQIAAAERFAAMTPEWYQSDYNCNTVVNYIINTPGLDLKNTSHYTLAFERLSAAKLLQTKPLEAATEPSEDEDERERNAPAPVPVPRTPTRLSTGVMQRDISGLPPKPTTRLKYSREQIADMSASDYKRLMFSDPELSRCVEYFAKQDRQARRVG